jgi:hypothetical protein
LITVSRLCPLQAAFFGIAAGDLALPVRSAFVRRMAAADPFQTLTAPRRDGLFVNSSGAEQNIQCRECLFIHTAVRNMF